MYKFKFSVKRLEVILHRTVHIICSGKNIICKNIEVSHTDVVLLQVESHSLQSGFEFNHLLSLDVTETVDASDTITNGQDTSGFSEVLGRCASQDALFQNGGEFCVCIQTFNKTKIYVRNDMVMINYMLINLLVMFGRGYLVNIYRDDNSIDVTDHVRDVGP